MPGTAGQSSPYLGGGLTIVMRRSRLGMVWRWRAECVFLVLLLACWWYAARLLGGALWGGVLLLGVLVLLGVLPWTRRFASRRLWCLVTRHRLQRVCWELRLHTRSGQLPLILRVHATAPGERAWLLARAGTCAADFENAAPEFAAACGAREARVTASSRWSQLIAVDIFRRDLLGPRRVVASRLLDVLGPVMVPAAPPPEADAAWPQIEPGEAR